MLEIYDNKLLNDIFRIVHDIIGHHAFETISRKMGKLVHGILVGLWWIKEDELLYGLKQGDKMLLFIMVNIRI